MIATDSVVENFLSKLEGVRQSGDCWMARCPAHEDRKASLSIKAGEDGRALLRCHAGCSAELIVAAIGLTMNDLFPQRETSTGNGHVSGHSAKLGVIVAQYDYCNEFGELLYQAVRFHPKDFRQRRPLGDGKWAWNLQNAQRVLYRLPELLNANELDTSAWRVIVEGEKDVDNLIKLGFCATCNVGGAGKWRAEYDGPLHGCRVVIVADKDVPGRKHAAAVASSLSGKAAEVKVIELPGDGVKDASDWIAAGGTAGKLTELIDRAAAWRPQLAVAKEKPVASSELIPLNPPSPPAFPDGIFTGWLGDQISAVAAATETPPELAVAFGLGSLAIATQGRFCVQLERGYKEELAFWIATALPPGSRKTPVMNHMARWCFKWQTEKSRQVEPEIRKATANRNIDAARVKELRNLAAKSKDETERGILKQQAQELEDRLPIVPVAPRMLVEDVTPEHLATLLLIHKERLGTISDEGGFLDNYTGRYSGGVANYDILLKAHTGSPVTQDRGSRPPAHLQAPLLSFGLAPQPAVVMEMASNKDLRRRGLPARFFFFMPPHQLGYRRLESKPVPDDVSDAYAARLVELAEMDGVPDGDGALRSRPLTLSGEAWRCWKDFALQVEHDMRTNEPLENLTDWAGKLPGAAARIAGLLHLADHGPGAIQKDEIQFDVMRRAVAFCNFAIPHAKLVFENTATSDVGLARRIIDEAKSAKRRAERRDKHGDDAKITARELWTPVRAVAPSVKEIEPAISKLIDHNFIFEVPTEETGKPGRPARLFQINPEALAQ